VVYLIFLFSYPDMWFNISLGVGFAILPDFLSLTKFIPGIKKIFKPLNDFHKIIQGTFKKFNELVFGLINQVIYLVFLITIFLSF